MSYTELPTTASVATERGGRPSASPNDPTTEGGDAERKIGLFIENIICIPV